RFLSADPEVAASGYGQSYDRYSYAANNPTTMVDPTGFAYETGGDSSGDSNGGQSNIYFSSASGQRLHIFNRILDPFSTLRPRKEMTMRQGETQYRTVCMRAGICVKQQVALREVSHEPPTLL